VGTAGLAVQVLTGLIVDGAASFGMVLRVAFSNRLQVVAMQLRGWVPGVRCVRVDGAFM